MAYSVNWITKVITIPLSDLTLISGTTYSLTTDDAHKELRRLEWEFSDGLWADNIIEYKNTEILSGIAYSPIIKIVNGYTWFVDTDDKVISLIGSNSNLLDTFIPGRGVSVLANNSGGKIESGASGGATAQEVWEYPLSDGNTAEEDQVATRKASEMARNLSA